WSPLARGFLTGSRRRGGEKETARAKSDEYADNLYFRPEDWGVLDAVLEVAKARGAKPAAVALAWVLAMPGVAAPIVGATKVEYLDDAAAALELRLSDEEIARLEAPNRPRPLLGHKQPTPRDVAASPDPSASGARPPRRGPRPQAGVEPAAASSAGSRPARRSRQGSLRCAAGPSSSIP